MSRCAVAALQPLFEPDALRKIADTLRLVNNPVVRPPIAGGIGLWLKTDSTSYFKDYVVDPK
jgi:hypothetical protein